MFVSDNSVLAVKKYFQKELSGLFGDREIKQIIKLAVVHRFHLDDNQFILANDLRVSESDLLFFRSVVKRLQKDEPIQYILGRTLFYHLQLKIDSRALIPRPETEELVDWVIETLGNRNLSILDLCSGSGCIALALKSFFKNSEIVGLDISDDAVSLARENAIETELNVDFQRVDVLNDHLEDFRDYHVWISNPPYIPIKERSQMQNNVLHYEPGIALFVEDEDPILFYRLIGEKAMLNLNPMGYLFLEIHELFDVEVVSFLESIGFVNIQLRKDLQGKARMIRAQKPNFTS